MFELSEYCYPILSNSFYRLRNWPVSNLLCVFVLILSLPSSQAQIVIDGSIGTTSVSISGPNYEIPQSYGSTQNGNLFHSFSEFSVHQSESASFNIGSDITNIISRVTGGNVSNIDGLLNVNGGSGDANLWMINPAGIVIGPDANIDIGGSLNVGAADYLSFADDTKFTSVGESVSLTVENPNRFGFLEAGGGAGVLSAGRNGSSGSSPLTENNSFGAETRFNGLLLAGRKVSLNDFVITSGPEKNIQGDITILADEISVIDSKLYTLTESAAHGPDIILEANTISLRDRTHIWASTESAGDVKTGYGGDIVMNANSIQTNVAPEFANTVFRDDTKILQIYTRGIGENSGAVGSISITGGSLELNETHVEARIQGRQKDIEAPKLSFSARDDFLLNYSLVKQATVGESNAGDVNISAGTFRMNNSAIQLEGWQFSDEQANDFGGDVGSLIIEASEDVQLQNGSRLRSLSSGRGKSAEISIAAGNKLEIDSAQIQSESTSSGELQLASISLEAPEIHVLDARIASETTSNAKGGDVLIKGDSVSLSGTTRISVQAFASSSSNAGTITVTANETIDISNDVQVLSTTASDCSECITSGIELAAPVISIRQDGPGENLRIEANTFGGSDGGEIRFIADELISIEGGYITASTGDSGDGGSIFLLVGTDSRELGVNETNTAQIRIFDGAHIEAETNASGAAGAMFIRAGEVLLNSATAGTPIEDVERVQISGESSGGQGGPGFVSIYGNTIAVANTDVRVSTASDRVLNSPAVLTLFAIRGNLSLLNSSLESSTSGASDSGFLLVFSGIDGVEEANITLDNSTIRSETSGAGNGERVQIKARSLRLSNGSLISSQASNSGKAGNVLIEIDDTLSLSGTAARPSRITTDALASAGGNIDLTVGGELRLQNGNIEATALAGSDNGGDIAINTGRVFMQEAGILARAADGNGGQINLEIASTEQALIIDSPSSINADSDSGTAGIININAPDIDLDSALQEQDANFLLTTEITEDQCSPVVVARASTFRQEDEGGTPLAPDSYLLGSVTERMNAAVSMEEFEYAVLSPQLLARAQNFSRENCR